MEHSATSALLRDLEAATERCPVERKLLVCASMGEGRELLRALAVRRSWLGWEVTTLRRLAMRLVAAELTAEDLAVADAFEEQAAVDGALDAALEDNRFGHLRELGEAPGFRQAVVNAVEALRLARVPPDRLKSTRTSNEPVRDLLVAVVDGYRSALAAARRIDTADVMGRAVLALRDRGLGDFDTEATFLVPGLSLRGSSGALAGALMESGAGVLRSDPVGELEPPQVVWNPHAEAAPLSGMLTTGVDGARGGDPPRVDLFAASGPSDEIREVLRRAMAAGLRWDEVEIVATDPVVYGGALHALTERLDIPVSYAVGLPVERTRAGRATAAWFRWIQAGYPVDVIRRLLESGDLRAPGRRPGIPPDRLARRLRALRIGWGADRYLPALERAIEALEGAPRARRNESEDEAARRVAREREELESLRSLLSPILAAVPRIDSHDPDHRVSPAELAAGLRAFLDRLAPSDGPSDTARDRLLAITGRIAATLHRPTHPPAAIALLRRHLEFRVPAPQREGSAPWVSAGGHLHLSDIDHGGHAARRATFVVGLDAERFPGSGLQDPLLLDGQRRDLDPASLPTSADRIAATRFRMAACLARLRGAVTLSYSAWDPTEAREVAPSSVMLQAFRARTERPSASFEELREGLGNAASAIPGGAALDATDLWFQALHRGGILVDGTEAVRRSYAGLEAGIAAGAALLGDAATAHHGAIRSRPWLDPRGNPELVLSASGLEDLGACARRYFYKYGLGIRKPDDPQLDPDVWLDAMNRGRLLHTVYEASLREARERGLRAGSTGFVDLALTVLEREAGWIAREVPPPGAAVRAREITALREDVRSFAEMLVGGDDAWEALELKFGFRGEPPAALELRGGTVRVRGAIDRVDRVGGTGKSGEALRVIDYKTGGSGRFERRLGTFNGGRRLQNVVYSAVAESLLGRPVERMEYHFPTRKGQNEAIAYDGAELRRGLGLIDRLLDAASNGRFLPTEEPSDCKFCDYAPICRHSSEGWQVEAPLADWAAAHFADMPEFRERREARDWEQTFLAELEQDDQAR